MLAPMEHREKVDRFVADLTGRGAWKSNIAPPLWQLFWKLGWNVRPPIYLRFFEILFSMGLLAGVLWTAAMWYTRHRHEPGLSTGLLVGGVVFWIGFSAVYAVIVAWMRKRYGLTTWNAYPDG